MYTKRPIQPLGEPLRLPEHYSGVAFSRKEPSVPSSKEETHAEKALETSDETKEEVCAKEEKADLPSPKRPTLNSLGGREDILLLILALLLLDDEGGDDMLAYILLGLLLLG